ncbi:MAG: OB-fold domain-containing protein [Actinomycetota bacterium]|nr:OB-fold domain-containing protein [Actinomycetota bacterium]
MSDAPVPRAAPVPVPDADTAPFWEAARERRLVVPRCASCGHWIWQPKPLCPRCSTPDPLWTEVDGAARLASWTVLRPPVLPAYADRVPFVIVLAELDEGVRLVGQLVGDDGTLLRTDGTAEGIAMDARLALRWRDVGDWTLPVWTLSSGPATG